MIQGRVGWEGVEKDTHWLMHHRPPAGGSLTPPHVAFMYDFCSARDPPSLETGPRGQKGPDEATELARDRVRGQPGSLGAS